MTGFLLHARFRRTEKSLRLTREIIRKLENHNQLGLWCTIHLASRFCFPAEILSLLRRNIDRVGADFWVARSAGGLFARLAGNAVASDHYVRLIRQLDSTATFDVYEYLLKIATANTLSSSTVAYIKAPNPTFPQRIYFPKVLALLALSQNASQAGLYASANKQHRDAFSDPFYKSMGLT